VHSYYFYLQSDSQVELTQRAARIESIAASFGLSCYREAYGDAITLQVETSDRIAAAKFRICVEVPLHESRGA
jgi:hypothetical protein